MNRFETLTFSKEIRQHMLELVHGKAQLNIDSKNFSSSGEARAKVVGFDETNNVLGLSFFRNTSGKTIRLASDTLYITVNANGIQYRFTSKIVPTDVLNAAYGIKVPRELQYLQRRNYFRVSVAKNSVYANLQSSDNLIADAEVDDISATGLRVTTIDAPPMAFNAGEEIPIINLVLAEVGEISFSAKVRSFRRMESGKYTLGLEIDKINNMHQVLIERYIAQRDRELRRKASGS